MIIQIVLYAISVHSIFIGEYILINIVDITLNSAFFVVNIQTLKRL